MWFKFSFYSATRSSDWENAYLITLSCSLYYFNIKSAGISLESEATIGLPNNLSQGSLTSSFHLASGYLVIIWMPATEMKSPMFPLYKIIPQLKYSTALHLVIVNAPLCWQGTFLKVSAKYVSHSVHTCAVHSLGSCFCHSFCLKNIPTHMLILFLFSSNVNSLVVFNSYISCSVDRAFYLSVSFLYKTNRNTTF